MKHKIDIKNYIKHQNGFDVRFNFKFIWPQILPGDEVELHHEMLRILDVQKSVYEYAKRMGFVFSTSPNHAARSIIVKRWK